MVVAVEFVFNVETIAAIAAFPRTAVMQKVSCLRKFHLGQHHLFGFRSAAVVGLESYSALADLFKRKAGLPDGFAKDCVVTCLDKRHGRPVELSQGAHPGKPAGSNHENPFAGSVTWDRFAVIPRLSTDPGIDINAKIEPRLIIPVKDRPPQHGLRRRCVRDF